MLVLASIVQEARNETIGWWYSHLCMCFAPTTSQSPRRHLATSVLCHGDSV